MSHVRLVLLSVALAASCASTAPPPERNATLQTPAPLASDAVATRAASADPALEPAPLAPAPAAFAQPTAPARGAVSFSLAVKARTRDGNTRVLFDGESLRSGDAFWLELRVFEPLHVYVLWVGRKGEATTLFPSERDLTLQPGEARRVPDEADAFFELDSEPGVERLLVVGSRNPTTPGSDPKLAHLLERIRSELREPGAGPKPPRAAPAATKSAPPPAQGAGLAAGSPPRSAPAHYEESSDYASRGVRVIKKGTASSFEVTTDDEGIFVVPLSIRHLP